METNSTGIPRQSISFKKKDKAWQQETVDAIIDQSTFNFGVGGHWRYEVAKWYEYYNGEIDPDDYAHVLKPYGRERKNMPAKLRNFNILKPTIDLLIGEYAKRPDNWTVVLSNGDVNTLKEREKSKKVLDNLKEHFLFELQRLGLIEDATEDGQEPQLPADVEAEFERSYKDARAIQGQQTLQYLDYKLGLPRQFRKGFFDFLVAGMAFSLKEVISSEVRYEILNPLDVDFDKSPDVEFIEDADWAVVRKQCLPSEIIDSYYEDLTADQVRQLENPKTQGDLPLFYSEAQRQNSENSRLVEVMRVFWKSLKKIGICHYQDEYGEWQMCEVEEDYKKAYGQRVDWYWVNEVWEGTRIDSDIYIRIRPFPVQRNSLDNPSICKLPVNGRIYSDRNAPFISLIGLGTPYQLLYNIYRYRLENAIAKAKGVIAQLDLDYIPDGWDMDKYMYYMDATGIAWQQRAKEGGIVPTHTHKEVLDLTVKAIEEHLALIAQLREEWETVSGVSRQRAGGMSQYDGKATTEQSIVQSSHITEDYFMKFEELIERDRAGLLDLSRIAFVTGKKGMFVLPDGTQGWLDLDGLQHMESEYGVHVSGSAKDMAKVNFIKQLGQQMIQANWSPLLIAEIMDTENFTGLKEKIREGEKVQQQLAEAHQRAEQEMQEQIAQIEQQKMAFDAEQNELDRNNRLEVALIAAHSRQQPPQEVDHTGLLLDERKHRDEMDHKKSELSLKGFVEKKKLELQQSKQKDDARLKEKEIAVKKTAANRPRK
jgi:hypothetical protein